MKFCHLFALVGLLQCFTSAHAQSIFVEAESFHKKGGWVVDPQFVEQMGSPYLLAHGMGKPVPDASTHIRVEKAGVYAVWVRTKNWVPGKWKAPGRFQIALNGQKLPNELGLTEGWNWEYAGKVTLSKGESLLSLCDLTGFEGRCDAVYLTLDHHEILPEEDKALAHWRKKQLCRGKVKSVKYDLVVVGGGIAGTAAAMSAAEHGLKVALVHDRPVLGGNACGEIRVHTLGIYGKFERILKQIDTQHFPNGSADAEKDDAKRMSNVARYEGIDLFLNMRAADAVTQNDKITAVLANHVETGEQIRFKAPLFVDCTGDGWIGYWAGAEYRYGRESVNAYDEAFEGKGDFWSPAVPDNRVMGASVLWNTEVTAEKSDFPDVPWALDVAAGYWANDGEWYWEYSSDEKSQIDDAEAIRDHMLRAIYGSFYNYKTERTEAKVGKKQANVRKRNMPSDYVQLKWVSYFLGKRESRRLIGDYVYTFNDVKQLTDFEDAVVFEKRSVDIHYQQNLQNKDKPDFLSSAIFYTTPQYSIPYRSLYSKNIHNLFMAGRHFSCSHAGLGGPRVMRTTGQMGAAVGIAASVCLKHKVSPREVYTTYLKELLDLIEKQQ